MATRLYALTNTYRSHFVLAPLTTMLARIARAKYHWGSERSER